MRLLITDTQSARPIFDDVEIEAFLVLESSNLRRAAALALETMAADQAYVLKVMTRGDLSTDGTKTAEGLLKRAATLRGQADLADEIEDDGADPFDWAEMVVDDFSARERIQNQALRGAL